MFGHSIPEFIDLSRSKPEGIRISDEDFRQFLNTAPQMLEGTIEAFSSNDPRHSLFCLECCDSSQWSIHTDSEQFARQLEGSGFVPFQPVPTKQPGIGRIGGNQNRGTGIEGR